MLQLLYTLNYPLSINSDICHRIFLNTAKKRPTQLVVELIFLYYALIDLHRDSF